MLTIRDRMIRALFKAQREREYAAFVKPAQEAGEEQHNANLANLYRGLEPQAREHLDTILAHRKKILDPEVASYADLYGADSEDYAAFLRFEQFSKEIQPEGNYFRYGKYTLPVKDFEASVFLYRHGIDRLKTAKNGEDY